VITQQTIYQIAKEISEKKIHENDLLLILGDALEEIGDVRSHAVRQHIHCCSRSYGIACNIHFEKYGTVFSKENIKHWNASEDIPDVADSSTWKCLPC
jgi:hypothetical protein